MKIGKRILSIVLALVMLCTMVTSVFYASAKEDSIQSVSAGTASMSELVADLLGEYTDGDKLISFADEMVAATIEGKITYDESGRQVITGLDESITAGGDAALEQLYAKYVGSGDDIVALGDKTLMDLLNNQKVFDVPIMQLRYVQNLDVLVKNLVLADNSALLQTAAQALQTLFPNVQPTYESIVSCLIPILSAFNFGEIMGNLDNIAGALGLASPVAFAYLAGIDSPLLTENYLNTINANLTEKGYTGTPVTALIQLTPEQQTQLLEYAAMEKGGKSLSEIAEAGFPWSDFAGEASSLDLANAFIKIALGDPDKLGAIAESDAGPALINLLCDLLNDIQDAPVSVILAKLSNAEDLSKIVDFAMSLLNGYDAEFKSYELFNNNIFVDGEGNTTFYDKLIKEDPAEYEYTGPKAMDQYLPVIAAGLDFLSNIFGKIQENEGDLIKTLFVDKLPQLGNVIRAAISYEDGGEQKVGVIAYFINDYKAYLQALNASLSDDVLISIAGAAIGAAQAQIGASNTKIAIWQGYLAQADALSDAAKLAKAKELGLLAETATVYDEEAVNAAIEAKAAGLRTEIEALTTQIQTDQQNLQTAQGAAQQAQDVYDNLAAFEDFVYGDPFYTDLGAVFEEQDTALIDTLRDDCENDFNAYLGAGKFDEMVSLIADNLASYDADGFIDDFIFGSDGLDYYTVLDDANTVLQEANQAVTDAENVLQQSTDALEAKGTELAALENGEVIAAINAAGDAATIYISDTAINAEGDFTANDIKESVKTIQTEEIAGYEATIAAEEAKITEYTADKAEQEAFVNAYDSDSLVAQQAAFNELTDALMVFLGGGEGTKSLYEYFNDGQPIEMLFAPDRVQALKTIVDGAIPLVGGFMKFTDENMKNVWAIEDILFGDDGILSTFYTDFTQGEPVIAVVSRVAPLADVAENVAQLGFFTEVIEQYKPLITAAAGLFGDNTQGFIASWNTPYADGGAGHHYINALLSLVPKIVDIYDLAKDVEQIAALVAPYEEIIELGLNFLTVDFYNDIMEDGFMKTILDKDLWKTVFDFAAAQVAKSDIEYKDLISTLIGQVYVNAFETFYEELKENPTEAITKRANLFSNILYLVSAYVEDFDIQSYESVISTKLFKGFIDMIPAEYRELVPQNIVATVTLFIRTIAFGEQAVVEEEVETDVPVQKYFYFTPSLNGAYTVTFTPQGAPMNTVYLDGESVALEQKGDSAVLTLNAVAGQTYEWCVDTPEVTAATMLATSAHEHTYAYTETVAPGCESAGEKVGTCTVCGKTVTEPIAPLGHDWGEWAQTKAPTCTAAGEESRVCSRDASHTQTKAVAALGHDWGEWVQTKAPTCTAAGEESRVCARDASHTETRAVPAAGHDYEVSVVKPTATKVGYTTYQCKNCDYHYVDSYTAPTGKLTLKCKARTANAETLIWNKVAGVSGYQIQVSTATGAAWASAKVTAANAYTFKGLVPGGAYKFRVRFYIQTPEGNKFSPWSLITSPTLPAGTVITKLTPAKRAFTAQWKKAAVNGYQVQYSLKANFAGAKTITVKNPKLLKATAAKLYAGKYYFVRIRTYKTIAKANYFSAWSKAYKVRTK